MTAKRSVELLTASPTFPERLAAVGDDGRALHRVLLRALAATRDAPSLPSAAREAGLSPQRGAAALSDLAAADLVALDDGQGLVGVFPLSCAATRHRVLVGNRPVLHAMCAVDALGIPAMLGEPGVVSSADPHTGEPVTVDVGDRGVVAVDPPRAVVLVGTAGEGSLASSCCTVIDFYADADRARDVLGRPGMAGDVLTVADAHALGVALFAGLLGPRGL